MVFVWMAPVRNDPSSSVLGMAVSGRGRGGGYHPTISPEVQDRIRAWHDRTYADMIRSEPIEVTCLGVDLWVPPQVFAPPPMAPLLAQVVQQEVRSSDRVLDMGTGSGINAILAASRSSQVVAVDINPHAVECASRNAKANGVGDRVQCRASDVFDQVDGRFDMIIFDPPFRWYPPRDLLEASITDEGYAAMTRFMVQVQDYLTEGGRVLVNFGTSGDLDYLLYLIDSNGFAREVLSEVELVREDWTVNYYVYRLTPKA